MARFAHVALDLVGNDAFDAVLGDPQVLAAAGVRRAGETRGMRAFASEPERTLVAPLFGVLPADWLALKAPGDRCVVLLRDPRDAVADAATSIAGAAITNETLAVVRPALVALDPRGRLEIAAYVSGTAARPIGNLTWAQHAPAHGALVCRFEDLLADPPAVFRSVFEHFGWDVADDVLRALVERSPLSRSAQAGAWRAHFDRNLAQRFENMAPGLVRALGYEERDDWWSAQPEDLPALTSREHLERDAAALRREIACVRSELDALRTASERLLRRCAALEHVRRARSGLR